jgi:hypothetical protein
MLLMKRKQARLFFFSMGKEGWIRNYALMAEMTRECSMVYERWNLSRKIFWMSCVASMEAKVVFLEAHTPLRSWPSQLGINILTTVLFCFAGCLPETYKANYFQVTHHYFKEKYGQNISKQKTNQFLKLKMLSLSTFYFNKLLWLF